MLTLKNLALASFALSPSSPRNTYNDSSKSKSDLIDSLTTFKRSILLLTFISANLLSQIDTRVLRHASSSFSICTSICHLDHALYLNLGSNSSFSEWTTEQWLFKLDYNLNTLDSIRLNDFVPTFPGDLLRLIDIEPNNGLLHLVLNIQNGQISAPFGNQYRSALIRLNSNLELIDFKQFGNDSTATSYGQIGFCNNGKIILGGAEYNAGSNWEPSVIKLDQDLQVDRLVIFDSLPESNNGLPYFIDKLSVIDDQILASTLPVASLQRKAILALDTSLTMQGYGSINTNINGNQASLYRGLTFIGTNRDSIYAIAILNWLNANGQRKLALGISKLDTNYNVSSIDTAQTIGGRGAQLQKNPFLYYEPASFKSPDSLIIAVNDNYISGPEYNLKDTNSFFLYSYNLGQMKFNWRKEVKTGLSNGWHSVEAIQGNRYVLAFS
ncbi:MAG: hypothetical protein NXI09_09115 [Bacteroidetes bacterium]|nr:hypothetical protein [Bacteroidota bacterium]